MSKKMLEPDLVDLNEWLSLAEAVEARAESGSPLSKQRLFALAHDGTISTRMIKTVRCWNRAELLSYAGTPGRPPMREPEDESITKPSRSKRAKA